MKNYITRTIDQTLLEWKERNVHKPLLLRGARQVGKSSAVRHVRIWPLYAISSLFPSLPWKEGLEIGIPISYLPYIYYLLIYSTHKFLLITSLYAIVRTDEHKILPEPKDKITNVISNLFVQHWFITFIVTLIQILRIDKVKQVTLLKSLLCPNGKLGIWNGFRVTIR